MGIVFNIEQTAEVLGLEVHEAKKEYDRDSLKGYRIPGSPDRRVPLEYVQIYQREHHIPATEKLADLIQKHL